MIASASGGFLADNTLTCNVGGRDFTKLNSKPVLAALVAKYIPELSGNYKGLYLVSDDPSAVGYAANGGGVGRTVFGFELNSPYTDNNGVVWYCSTAAYYMPINDSYTGSVVDLTSRVYSVDEIDSFQPMKDILAAAAPVVAANTDDVIYGSRYVLDGGSSVGGNDTMYWNLVDDDISTFAWYSLNPSTLTQYYPKTVNLTAIEYAPRTGYSSYIVGTTVQGLTGAGEWETLLTITSAPTEGQTTTIPISTGHKYIAVRLSSPYLGLSIFDVHGTYNSAEVLTTKRIRFDFLETKDWYSNMLCLSDISIAVSNGGGYISSISAEFNNGNAIVTPTYLNSTSLNSLIDGDSTTECDISWHIGGMLSITCELICWGDGIASYTYSTSNSSAGADPSKWRVWESINSIDWALKDGIVDAALPDTRRIATTYTVTAPVLDILYYIQSDGSQFINTGVYGADDVDVEITVAKYMPYDYDSYHNSWGGVISGRQNGYSSALDISVSQGRNAIVYQYGNTSEEYSYTFETGVQYIIANQGSSLYIDNVLIGTNSSNTFTSPVPMTLFARNTSSAGSLPIEYGALRMYGAKIRKNGNLIRNFIPRRLKGVVGMYDTISGGFFPAWGPYDFIPSDHIPESEYVETDGNIFFSTGLSITSGKMRCELDMAYTALNDNPCMLSNQGVDISAGTINVDTYNQYYDIKNYYTGADRYTAYVSKDSFSMANNLRTKLTMYVSGNGLTAKAYGRTAHTNGYAVSNNPLYLCCAGASLSRGAKARIYSVKIWDDKTLILDAAPMFLEDQYVLYDTIRHGAVSTVGDGILLPTWYIINNDLTNIAFPEVPVIGEPYPTEYWYFDDGEVINQLTPAKIPVATPPYPYQMWQHYDDDGLLTGFCLKNPLLGAFCHSPIRKIEIPPTVKKIGPYAFRESGITAVTIASDCVYEETSFAPGCRIYTYN